MSRLLAIDTATEACSVALMLDDGGARIIERFIIAGRDHSAQLGPLVFALLADAGVAMSQLDGIACSIGPGSFAGVRIGVAFVKGLALGLDRPVVGVSSLAMLAQGAVRQSDAATVVAAIDARMGEVYLGAYRNAGGLVESVGDDHVLAPAAAGSVLAGALSEPASESSASVAPQPGPRVIGAGSGWAAHGEVLRQSCADAGVPIAEFDANATPRAADALRLAAPVFAAGGAMPGQRLVPRYLRDRVALTSVEQAAARAAR